MTNFFQKYYDEYISTKLCLKTNLSEKDIIRKFDKRAKGIAGEKLVYNHIKCRRCDALNFTNFHNSNQACVDLKCYVCNQYYQIKVVSKQTQVKTVRICGGSYNKIINYNHPIDYIIIIIDNKLNIIDILYTPHENINKKTDIVPFVLGVKHKQSGYKMCNIVLKCFEKILNSLHSIESPVKIDFTDVKNNISQNTKLNEQINKINQIDKKTRTKMIIDLVKEKNGYDEFKFSTLAYYAETKLGFGNCGGKTPAQTLNAFLQKLAKEKIFNNTRRGYWQLLPM